jgi:hypothetical protein
MTAKPDPAGGTPAPVVIATFGHPRRGPEPRRRRAPHLKQRLDNAIAAAKAAGAPRLKIKTPDGASYEFELQSAAEPTEAVNDFDRPPNPRPAKRGNATKQ